jgi:putative peptidoglycan lipid II flippase
MAAFLLSNLTGLLRQVLVAGAFGTEADIDAFNAANRVSETLFTLVAGGALASAFLPTFTGFITRKEHARAWRLASAVTNLVLIVSIIAAILVAIFAPQVVRYILAPGFAGNPAQEALTISLLRLMLPSAIIFAMSGLVMAILNSHQVFFIPALAPSMYQLGLIFGVLVLRPSMGIYGLGWGVIVGALLHLLLQAPSLLRLGGKYYRTLGLELPEVGEVARLMLPRLLGVAVVQLNFWVNTRLASQFVEGSVTGIGLAFALMYMPQAAIAQSIAIAALPTFSAQVALGKMVEMRTSLASSLRWALLLSLPASVGLILLRTPIVTLLYQRGEFTAFSTQLVAWALLWYAAGMVGHSLVEILSRAFYSLHDTKTPVVVGVAAMGLNIVFSYLYSALFIRLGWMPHGGLALANSFATFLEGVVLFYLMKKRLDGLHTSHILEGVMKALLASLGMALVLSGWLAIMDGQPAWLVGLGGVALGAGVFLALSLAFGIGEIRQIWQRMPDLVARIVRRGRS